jgi:hypothetical protein
MRFSSIHSHRKKTTQPGLPMKKGRAATMTHDYNRHGVNALCLSGVRPPHFPPAHRRVASIRARVGLRVKRMLKRMVKSIAHGPAPSHSRRPAEMWRRCTAEKVHRLQLFRGACRE